MALIVLAWLAAGATRTGIPRLYTDGSFLALPARLMLGCAILVCAMNALLRFFPGNSSAWIIVAVLAVLAALGLAGLGKAAGGGVTRASAGTRPLACVIVFSAGVFGWRLLGQLSLGALVPVEGTGCADELWYIFSADWLRTHSLADPFATDPAYPLAMAARFNIGSLPRIGAESLLVLVSSVAGTPLEQVYPVLSALAAVLFGLAASQGFLHEGQRDWTFLALALPAVALSPVALFIYGNENFATLWGLVFLAGYYWHIQHALWESAGQGSAAAAGIFLGALVATYPELLAVAAPATLLLAAQGLYGRHAASRRTGARRLLLCGLVAAAAAPWALPAAFQVLSTGAAAVQGPNLIFGDLYTALTPSNFLLTLLALDTQVLAGHLGGAGPAFAGVVLALALLFAPKRVWQATGALALACLPLFALFWLQNYGYGGMKAIEFLALPAATLLGAAAGRIALPPASGQAAHGDPSGAIAHLRALRVFAHGACVVLALLLLGAISCERWRAFIRYGANAHLDAALRDLASARAALPAGAVLLVGPELGPHPFLSSRWVAYLLRDVPLVYPPELHGGGYLYYLETAYAARRAAVTHVLRARTAEGASSKGAAWRNARFEIVPMAQVPFQLEQGFHAHEGWGRWMAARAVIGLRGSCRRELRIRVGRRFEAIRGEDALIVSAGASVRRYRLQGGRGEIRFAVPAGAARVELLSAAGGLSPSAAGARDERVLSYGIEAIGIEPCPPRAGGAGTARQP